MKPSPTPWSVDHEENGDGADRFDSYFIVDANGRKVCDTLNADAVVDHDGDEHGVTAWDEQGRANMERIVAAVNGGPAWLDEAAAQMEAMRLRLVERIKAKGYSHARVDFDIHSGGVSFWMMTDGRNATHGPKAFAGVCGTERESYTFARGVTFSEAYKAALAAIDAMDRVPDYSAWFDVAQFEERAAS